MAGPIVSELTLITMLIAQHLRQPGRLDLWPLPHHPLNDRHQRVKLEPAGARTYRGGASDANARATVRR
jgi:hypothetical protein